MRIPQLRLSPLQIKHTMPPPLSLPSHAAAQFLPARPPPPPKHHTRLTLVSCRAPSPCLLSWVSETDFSVASLNRLSQKGLVLARLWFCQLEMCGTWLGQNSSGVRHGGGARQEKRFVFWERRRRGSIGDEFETSVVFWGRRWPGWEKLGGGVAWEGERRRRSVFDLERRESELRNP
ncbi:hypothetical protein Droror1_Dr00027912, partial [Drosera rotundifolia]